jgi:hypothetical protein
VATKLAVQRLCEKYKKRRLKKDYAFKQALLSAEPKIIKAALDKQRIPHSDEFAMMHIARYLTSKIQDHPVATVQAALKKYDEYFRKDV